MSKKKGAEEGLLGLGGDVLGERLVAGDVGLVGVVHACVSAVCGVGGGEGGDEMMRGLGNMVGKGSATSK